MHPLGGGPLGCVTKHVEELEAACMFGLLFGLLIYSESRWVKGNLVTDLLHSPVSEWRERSLKFIEGRVQCSM